MSSKAALAAMLLTTVSALREAEAFEVKHAPGGQLVRWTKSTVAFTIDRTVRRVPGGEDAVAAATRVWTKQAGAPALSVGKTNAKLSPGLDGTSGVFFAADGFEPAGKALAITILSFDAATGVVLEADIVLNGRYKLGRVDPSRERPSSDADADALPYDVERVVAHEMGHALALSDELTNADALMYPFVERARVLRATPGADDVAGLEMLYSAAGVPEPTGSPGAATGQASGCGGVVARSGPRSAPWTALLAVGLVVAALVIARGRRRGRAGTAGAAVLAAGALVVLPPGTSARMPEAREPAFDAPARVESVRTTSVNGVFRSEVELRTLSCEADDCPASGRTEVWGGTLAGVRQVVGGVDAPRAGERVGVVFDRGAGRAITTLVRVTQEGGAR